MQFVFIGISFIGAVSAIFGFMLNKPKLAYTGLGIAIAGAFFSDYSK